MLQATFEMNFPSIALREVDSFNNLISFGNTLLTIGKWQVLYQNGVVENSYNPDWSDPWNGNGWVDTRAAGYVNIKQYPWIYHPELGWLKVTEGDIITLDSQDDTSPRALSFYLYSANYGWLWTTEFTEKYYSFTDEVFKTVEEITGG